MKEQTIEPIFEIIENNESILAARAIEEEVIIAVVYNKQTCKESGIDSMEFTDIYYPKDDRYFLIKLKNKLNIWLRENHSEKFM
ncbi:hypothetical protein [Chryseobacterium sediminis]|uniref:Uncharacterized protein n=1 Tax=Chryseobacterium sediminis TaxID=1679494 RepID=A0A5B2U9B7_9FLAO|nr:hypothetical protein [Chryseobacterium sediminis]KAA2223026.1 hypothetical protein FW780_02140 [Chryseobacterium sediminis]